MSSTDRNEGVLCLIGAPSLTQLETEICRLQKFLERSTGAQLIDVVYTATCDARGQQCVVGMWVSSLEEIAQRLKFALSALRSGRTRMRDKSGVFFTTQPLALKGGKVAYIFPGTGSFHLEMMRDLALTFDGVRQQFDDMEEAFSGFCDVASPSEWLFSTSPEHTLPLSDSQAFLPLLATASTYLASKVFADFLRTIGVHPDAVGGVGLGSFTAFHATYHDPKLKLVQILRDAGKMLLRLGVHGAQVPWIQLTVSGIETQCLEALIQRMPTHVIITQYLSKTECILAVSPDKQTEVEIVIHNGGGLSVAEPLLAPFNTGLPDIKMRQMFLQFFAKWIHGEPEVPFYSCVTNEPMPTQTRAVIEGLVDQMMQPLHFKGMIEQMYEDGCRIFVEVGARGLLTPIIESILKEKPEPITVIPMHILHRSGSMQVGQALGLLAAHGVKIDYSGLRFFAHAKRVDFNEPVMAEAGGTLRLRLTRELPTIHPELVETKLVTEDVTASSADETLDHSHLPTHEKGLHQPLLREIEELAHGENNLTIRCTLSTKNFPYFNDYAIGTTLVSLCNPQMRGLTLFSMPSGIELMAEVAQRLMPDLVLQEVKHLRAQRWLSFDFGKLIVRVIAVAGASGMEGQRSVRVRLFSDEDIPDSAACPVLDAYFIFGRAIKEAVPQEIEAIVNPKLVNWQTRDIYPARLFQGPLLRNVQKVTGWGFNGIDYEIRMPARRAAVRSVNDPLFTAMPLLLDAVISGFSLWRSHERFHGAIALPFRCHSIQYFAAWIREGTRLKASLRLVNVTPRSHQVNIVVTDSNKHTVMTLSGWEELSGHARPELHHFVMNPVKYFITQPLPASILPEGCTDVIGALYVNSTPDFFISNQELWLKALAAAILTSNEREDFAEMGGAPLRRLEWLLGRTVAKESVRRALLQNYNLCTASADIAIWKDDLGKPHPLGEWQSRVSTAYDLSIAHTSGLILGAVSPSGRIGLDVESTSRDLTEDFLRGVFTIEEQELATKSGDGPTAVLRFWCAKEAISKALGTGIRFAPTDLRIRSSSPATGMLEIELLGMWAKTFPAFKQKRIPIKTSVLYQHAIAACVLPLP